MTAIIIFILLAFILIILFLVANGITQYKAKLDVDRRQRLKKMTAFVLETERLLQNKVQFPMSSSLSGIQESPG